MIECPHTQCDSTLPNEDALRNHSNAKRDHDWDEIREQLRDDSDEPDEQGNEQPDSDTNDDEQGDQSVEQGETGENSENDQPESSENEQEAMVSDDELELQRQQSRETSSENSQTATTETSSQTSQTSSQIPLPIPRSWLLGLAALAALGLLVMWVRQGDRPDDQPDIGDDELDEIADSGGRGLISQ